MDLYDKLEMVMLSNSGKKKAELQAFIIKNIDNLDPQAWDMIANGSGMVLIEESIIADKYFYGKLYKAWNKLTFRETKYMSTRALLRIEVFTLMYKELKERELV